METAEEARNAPRFEATACTPGLLAAQQFNPFVPTQEDFSIITAEKHTNSLPLENVAAFGLCCYFLIVPINTRRCSRLRLAEKKRAAAALLF